MSTVCDEGDGQPAKTYTLTDGERKAQTDLCLHHGELFEMILSERPKRRNRRTRPAGPPD